MTSRDFSQVAIFLGTLIVSLIVQQFVWNTRNDIVDQWQWGKAVESASKDFFYQPEPSPEIVNSAYGYPGTTVVLPSAALVRFGVATNSAMQDVLAVSIALGIALVVWMCYRVRPRSYWWAAAALLLIISDSYYIATPPSSIVTIWFTFVLLSVVYVLEHTDTENTGVVVGMGLVTGYMIATRYDISLMLAASVVTVLLVTFKKIPWVYIVATFCALCISDPYLLLDPIKHLAVIIYKTTQIQSPNFLSHPTTSTNSIAVLILEAVPPATLTFLGALVCMRNPVASPFSQRILLWLTGTTAIICAIFLSMHFRVLWYFAPPLLFWEAVLPLFLVSICRVLPGVSPTRQTIYASIIFTGIVVNQLYLFINILRI